MTGAPPDPPPIAPSARVEPVRTLFLGSGAFAVPLLERLAASSAVAIVGVITAPPRPAGRHGVPTATPVQRRAEALGLPVLALPGIRTPAARDAVARLDPVVGVLADYGRIVPPEILSLVPRGILNLHPSPLPRHRGATPIQATILAGDREAGVTVIHMDAGLDTGPIVGADRWALDGTERAPDLEERAAARGADLVMRILLPWAAGGLVARPQDEGSATLTRPLRREDGRLDPTRPAVELERRVRAMDPWPGTFLDTSAGRLLVRSAHPEPSAPTDRPGVLVADGGGLILLTAAGRLRLETVQVPGGRPLPAAVALRGHPRFAGATALPGGAT